MVAGLYALSLSGEKSSSDTNANNDHPTPAILYLLVNNIINSAIESISHFKKKNNLVNRKLYRTEHAIMQQG
jgi:hypothetical protein